MANSDEVLYACKYVKDVDDSVILQCRPLANKVEKVEAKHQNAIVTYYSNNSSVVRGCGCSGRRSSSSLREGESVQTEQKESNGEQKESKSENHKSDNEGETEENESDDSESNESICGTCSFIDGDKEYAAYSKYDETLVNGATLRVGGVTVTFSNVSKDRTSFSWTSDKHGVVSVRVKCANKCNSYNYDGTEMSGDNLSTLVNPKNGKLFKIAYVQVCVDTRIIVLSNVLSDLVSAGVPYTKDWSWEVSRVVDKPLIDLNSNSSTSVLYTMTFTPSCVSGKPKVTGLFTVTNNSTVDVVVSNLVLQYNPIGSSLDIENLVLPLTLAAGASSSFIFTANYNSDISSGTISSILDVTYAGLTKQITNQSDFTVDVIVYGNIATMTDKINGDLGTSDGVDGVKVFTYSQYIEPYPECKEYTIMTTANATYDTAGGPVTVVANCTVTVNVTGCVVSIGCVSDRIYWFKYSILGGYLPRNPAWDRIPGGLAENTLFFNTGVTWINIIRYDSFYSIQYPAANDYIVAMLNKFAGADTSTQDNNISRVRDHYLGITVLRLQILSSLRQTLWRFNTGQLAVPMC